MVSDPLGSVETDAGIVVTDWPGGNGVKVVCELVGEVILVNVGVEIVIEKEGVKVVD